MTDREFFVILRSNANTDTAAVLLQDIYDRGKEYVIGGYTEKTAMIVFKAVKTVLQQIKEANKGEQT